MPNASNVQKGITRKELIRILEKLPEGVIYLDIQYKEGQKSFVDVIRNIDIGNSKENAFLPDGCIVLTNKGCCGS